MNLQTLKSHLDAINNNSLTLDALDTLLPQEFRTFLQSAPNSKIALHPAANTGIRLEGSILIIEGDSSDKWSIQGMMNKFVTLTYVTITITDKGSNPPTFSISAIGILPVTVTAFVQVAVTSPHTENGSWSVTLLEAAHNLTPIELLQLGVVGSLPFDLPTNLDMLNRSLTVIKDQFKIEFYPNTSFSYRYSFSVSASDARWELIQNVLTIQGLEISAFLMEGSVGCRVVGHVQIGSVPVKVGVGLDIDSKWLAFIEPVEGSRFPGLTALAELAGGSALSQAVEIGFNNVGFGLNTFELAISRVAVGFDWEQASLNFIDISSVLTLKDINFDIVVRLPDFTLIGQLKHNSPIKIRNLAGSFGFDNSTIPDTLVVTGMRLIAHPSTSFYAFDITVDNVWSIGSVELQEIKLTISYFGGWAGSGFKGQFDCLVKIADVELWLSADSPEGDSGWQFSGRTLEGDTVQIGNLIKDLGDKFGIDVPAPISNIELDSVNVLYNTNNQDFSFNCEGLLAIEPNNRFHIKITIDLKPKTGSERGETTKNKYEAKFSGHITIGTLQFNITFDRNNSSNTLVATYSNQSNTAIPIKELLENVTSNQDLLNLLESLEIDLKNILFAFTKNDTETKFLFGLDIRTDINLSNLPLVGKEFPRDQFVGVDDLQIIVVASEKLYQREVNTFNTILGQAGLTQLPIQPQENSSISADSNETPVIKKGLYVAAQLKFGSITEILTLPVAARTKENTTSTTLSASERTDTPTTLTTASTSNTTLAPADNTKWFNLQKTFSPVHFERVGIQYKDAAIWFLLDAALSAAGLTLSLDGLSVGSPLSKFEPKFNLKGIGIDYRGSSALEIGGAFLKVGDNKYDGTAIIKTEELTISAIGSYTEINGHPSLFIYATLDYPIGGPAFFFVTGLAAGFGYNRTLLLPSIEQVAQFPLIQAAINSKPQPNNASQLTKKLESIKQYIPPATGEIFLAVGIKFTSFKMIDSFALLTIAFGNRFELNLLGISTLIAPTPEAEKAVTPLAEVQLALKATFIPDDGILQVQAQLTPSSYLFSRNCHLTGGFAFYTWFGNNTHAGDFILTLGGYHPNYQVPDHYPQVPRLGFNWQVDEHLTLKGDAYYALTPSALMAGGHLQATWESGPLKAWFNAGADFLIGWKPYHYEAHIYVDIGASYQSFLGPITVDVGADLQIWGPDFSGKAEIHLSIISFEVTFGKDAPQELPAIDWKTFHDSFLPPNDQICSIAVKDGLVTKASQDKLDLGVINPKHFCLVTNSVIPSKQAYLGSQPVSLSEANTKFGIVSMAVESDKLTSTHTITITKDGKHVEQEEFNYVPIYKNVPTGLWKDISPELQKNVPPKSWDKILKPDLNQDGFINQTLSGFEIRPKSEPSGGHPEEIDFRKLQYKTKSIPDAYNWENIRLFRAEPLEDKYKFDKIKATIENNSARNKILEALGFGIEEIKNIKPNASIANDFLLAPQVGALAS